MILIYSITTSMSYKFNLYISNYKLLSSVICKPWQKEVLIKVLVKTKYIVTHSGKKLFELMKNKYL
jgi:predicted transcriptional regulator